jgi:hypothetical protein
MGLLRAFSICGIALLGLIGCAQSERQSAPDGSVASTCKENFADPPACATNFFELIARKSQFFGKNISLIGYVGQDDGLLVFYPSEQAYANRDVSSALSVRGNESIQSEVLKDCAYKYCAVSGVFRGGDKAEQNRYLGSIWPGKHLTIRAREKLLEPLKMRSEDMFARAGGKSP